MKMFGGDDVGAIVVDMGSVYTKVGYAGEGNPKCIMPTVVGNVRSPEDDAQGAINCTYVGERALYRRDHTQIVSPVQYGVVADWDGVEHIWSNIFSDQLRVIPSQQPVMLADPSFNSPARRQKMAELLFEKFNVPGLFLGRSAVLASFSLGKTTSLVVDCGGGVTSVVPVHEGYVLNRGVRKTKLAGQMLDMELKKQLFDNEHASDAINNNNGGEQSEVPKEEAAAQVPPPQPQQHKQPHKLYARYEVDRSWNGDVKTHKILEYPNVHPSYRRHMQLEVIRDIKESLAVLAEVPFRVHANFRVPGVDYELPDGKILKVGSARFKVSELLFSEAQFQDLDDHRGFKFQGLDHMIRTSIDACDVDMRRDLYANIIPCGGTSLFNGLHERLFKELNSENAPALKAKLQASNIKAERHCAVWIGGSILASLGSFHQMWLSRAEYDEIGADSVNRKCP